MSDLLSRFRTCLLGASLLATGAAAQGFQLQQHEPAAAGEGFFAVRSPRYDAEHALAVALTLNYGHHPLLGGHLAADGSFVADRFVISDQLVGHLDVAGVLFGRLQLSGSLPVTLLERGEGGYGVAPVGGPVVGDPRLGARFRLLGSDDGALGVHVGGDVWIPVGVAAQHAGDTGARGLVGVILDGQATPNVRWALNGGVLWRPRSSLNLVQSGHGTAGTSLQTGIAVGYVATDERFRVGPELVFSTGLNEDAFTTASTRLEALLGGGVRIGDVVEIGPAVGVGISRSAGTPDFRGLLRVTVLPFGGSSTSGARTDADAQTDRAEEDPAQQQPEQTQPEQQQPAEEEPLAEESAPEESAAEAPVDEARDPQASPAEQDAPVRQAPATAAPGTEARKAPRTAKPRPAAQGQALVVVRFASDSEALTPESQDALARAVADGNARDVRLSVEGHGDNRGPERWNEVLSELRARSVMRHLESLGIPATRMSVQGFGSSQPAQSNDTRSGRAENRRVEVKLEGAAD